MLYRNGFLQINLDTDQHKHKFKLTNFSDHTRQSMIKNVGHTSIKSLWDESLLLSAERVGVGNENNNSIIVLIFFCNY